MREDLSKALYAKHPELFEGNPVSLDVGDGWYILLDTLCDLLLLEYRQVKARLEKLGQDHPAQAQQVNDELAFNADNCLVIVQVKEKFGSLRFYANHVTEWQKPYIDFAEAMSSSICQDCGKLGSIKSDKGWLNCRCGECRVSSEETHFHG